MAQQSDLPENVNLQFNWVETIAWKEVWLVWKLALKQGGELWLKQLAKAAKHLRNDSGGWSFSKLEELFGNPLKILRVYVEREEKKRLTEIYIELCPIRIWKVFDNIFSEYAALISKEKVCFKMKNISLSFGMKQFDCYLSTITYVQLP